MVEVKITLKMLNFQLESGGVNKVLMKISLRVLLQFTLEITQFSSLHEIVIQSARK
jgi:hypothetical protein